MVACGLLLVPRLVHGRGASVAGGNLVPAVEPGVSKQLAEWRAASVSNVSYRLGFVVPGQKDVRVAFTDTISFDYNPPSSGNRREKIAALQIDFQGQLSKSKPVIINGKRAGKSDIKVSDEHIIVAAGKLKRGRNTLILKGTSLDDKLNRQSDYLYTLFVPAGARSAFPCFDQPDLKAHFYLTLHLPDGWTSVSSEQRGSHPIPTYLFSFAAGRFQEQTAELSGRRLRALYRETDPDKVAQLPDIFNLVDQSIRWLEEYTGIAYPFDRYEMVLLPGYQFGGMEHPGAIQYKERTMLLSKGATVEDELRRLELVAHETAHMWFGDMVTMKWFDDVWTKEVFANFMAEKISREVFPDVNRQLNFLKHYQLPAIATDRTRGTHPIQQQLDNLRDAGLLYGNIIYYKAPVMMGKLEQQMGDSLLREGLRNYLLKYSYGNATWDNLIEELDKVAPQAHLPEFSRVWVKEKGLPFIETRVVDGDSLEIVQQDPWGRGLVWPQSFKILVSYPDSTKALLTFATAKAVERIPLPLPDPDGVVASLDGSGYGRFVMRRQDAEWLMERLEVSHGEAEATQRLAALSMLYDQWLMHRLEGYRLARLCMTRLALEENSMVFSHLTNCLGSVMSTMSATERHWYEQKIYALSQSPLLTADLQRQLKRSFYASFCKPELVDSVYKVWSEHDDDQFVERDYNAMAYVLAMRRPAEWREILATQRERLKTIDEQREFDFVSRACNPSADERMKLFESLRDVDNRRVEPWASGLLSLLCHESRGEEVARDVKPGLALLQEIQQTGDFFFPTNWIGALLGGQRSAAAREVVEAWISSHRDTLMPALMNKVEQSAFFLLNGK